MFIVPPTLFKVLYTAPSFVCVPLSFNNIIHCFVNKGLGSTNFVQDSIRNEIEKIINDDADKDNLYLSIYLF
jgi:hypothetical protein